LAQASAPFRSALRFCAMAQRAQTAPLGQNRSQSLGALTMARPGTALGGTRPKMGRTGSAPGLRPKPVPVGVGGTGIWGEGPPRAGSVRWRRDKRLERHCLVFENDDAPATMFRRMYERGDLPVTIKHGAVKTLEWKIAPEKVDYHHYLPVFIEGLREKADPYMFVALFGTRTLIEKGGGLLLPVIPQIVMPLKQALVTREPQTVVKALDCLQMLVKNRTGATDANSTPIGEALVPYYRQLLPMLNLYKAKKLNLGDGIDYSQAKRDFRNIGELIEETLNLLEQSGGVDAFINIKYMVPTYESCMEGAHPAVR